MDITALLQTITGGLLLGAGALLLEVRTICACLLYTSPSPRDGLLSRMPSSA